MKTCLGICRVEGSGVEGLEHDSEKGWAAPGNLLAFPERVGIFHKRWDAPYIARHAILDP